jgi:hypothetical protein
LRLCKRLEPVSASILERFRPGLGEKFMIDEMKEYKDEHV